MKLDLKAAWTNALRSGNYKQAIGKLKGPRVGHSGTGVGHCCLGVLLDIVEPNGWETDGRHSPAKHKRASTTNNGGAQGGGYISSAFAHSLGIPAGMQKQLARLNDRGNGFEDIADYIDTHIPTTEA